ncbi:MAG: hypothetical protein NZM28_01740 [Fimbriimonadales bacterium]|nr:hypothetical protein [Fimbriimonadales bacterium]
MHIKRTVLLGYVLGCVAALGAYMLYRDGSEPSTRQGVLSSEASGERTSYYLNTEQGIAGVRAERFTVPFSLQTVEWRSDAQTASLTIHLTNSVQAQKDAGYCVEIVANANRTLIWWGYNLRPKIAPDLREDQAAIVDTSKNAVIGYGQVEAQADTIQVTLPTPLDSVEAVYLRYIPSQQAFKQSGGSVDIVSIVRAQPAPSWGARVRSVQGGYLWHEETH